MGPWYFYKACSEMIALIHSLKTDFLQNLTFTFLLHVQFGSEITVTGLKNAKAVFGPIVLTLVLDLEIFHVVVAEEVFQNHFTLATTVIVVLTWERNIDPVIKKTR